MTSLDWILATCVISEVRDGGSAVNFAEKALAATDPKAANTLDTLAAAHAEFGQFDQAVRAEQEAIALSPDKPSRKDYVSRLKFYESNRP